MSRTIPDTLRQFVAERANFSCEYCRLPNIGRFISFHIEHIRSLKHGGQTVKENLAYSCPHCNYHKGSDIGTFLDDDHLIRFFNPRKDEWGEHFEILNGVIYPKTKIAEATAKILQFNTPERIIYRRELLS
jgi:HNH endonuclease